MSEAAEAEAFPTLYFHERRKEWGVSVASGEHDGKRSYLFEGGEERTISAASLMLFSQKALESWLKLERFETIWKYALEVLGASALADEVPRDHFDVTEFARVTVAGPPKPGAQ